ncbi:hypothetical protein V5O48_001825 [Marasmius crinis-equi]|uniref:Uncharacterized protein n=1 Tax=Marasmius crinis-equi TaxID=585013 RepID=A0ABR3FX91_9AGAR
MNASNPAPDTPDPEHKINEEPEIDESGSGPYLMLVVAKYYLRLSLTLAQPSTSRMKSGAAEGTPIDLQGGVDNSILDALERMAISLEELTAKSQGSNRGEQNQQQQATKNTGSSNVSIYRVQSLAELNHLRFPEHHCVRVFTRADQQGFYLITGKTKGDVDEVAELLGEENISDGQGEGSQTSSLIWGLGGMLVGMAGTFTGLAFVP